MIERLTVHYFRNLVKADDLIFRRLNLLYGSNGSGKTSLLEALYYLIMGRSFRAHQLQKIINYQQSGFRVAGLLHKGDRYWRIGIERGFDHAAVSRIDGENVSSQAAITALQPVQLLNYDSNRLLSDAGVYRRQFADWGLFHQQEDFMVIWRSFERAVKQRNFALRAQTTPNYLRGWNNELVHYGVRLSECRRGYLLSFNQLYQQFAQALFPDEPLMLRYYQGWPDTMDLAEALEREQARDFKMGYTTIGPQRADWWFELSDGRNVRDVYSRGQQKLLVFSLQLAQGMMLYKTTQRSCLYLIDDLLAELDQNSYQRLLKQLTSLPSTHSQFFITGLLPSTLPEELVQLYPDWQQRQVQCGVIS